ncbi:MAG TPA: hypothetical protein VF472_24115 [Burkholderiaceae bacterium]
MDQLNDYADDRLINGCIYCGGRDDTREHVPSKVFLDAPFPENLPVVGACGDCNNGFSADEEYLACLVEAVVAGTADPERMRRPSVANILRRSPALRSRIEAARTCIDGQTRFTPEADRVKNVLVKLARGHAAFELSQPCKHAPASAHWVPLALLDENQLEQFESCEDVVGYGEIGSRGMQRLLIVQMTVRSASGEEQTLNMSLHGWVDVQAGRYRYHAAEYGDEIRVKMVIGEYLACEVVWEV